MLYVLRHGQVATNVNHRINGWNEEPLTEVGIRQAQAAGDKLRSVAFAAVYCSPLLRTRQTYQHLGRDTSREPVYYDDRLRERFSGAMTMHQDTEADTTLWYDPAQTVIYRDTEGFAQVIARVKSLLTEIHQKYGDQNVLLVTHGDICKAIRLCFYPETQGIDARGQGNCEIVTYRWPD